MSDQDGMSDTERYTRLASDLAGAVGGIALTYYGGGSAVKPLQQLKGTALDAAFPKINPQPRIDETIRDNRSETNIAMPSEPIAKIDPDFRNE